MKYMVAIETTKMVEVESETAEAAIESVKQKINYKPTDSVNFSIVKELFFNTETNTYEIEELKEIKND